MAPSSPEPEPPVTTETFQQHYGRGSGYPDDYSHHHGHPPPPPPPHSQQSYPPSHYASGPPPPLPPRAHGGHRGGPHPPPPPHDPHEYHHPSWGGYYPPHAAAGAPSAHTAAASSTSSRSSSRAAKKSNMPPTHLVTPKSHDSETLPPVAADTGKTSGSKKSAAKSPNKKANKKVKKESQLSSSANANNDKEPEMEEEPKVEPMKQDFHFYAKDEYEELKEVCQQQLDNSIADGSKENQLYMMTTLLNARLIQNWEMAPSSTRAEYLKKEEADRKRFMSEEEVASRHCATLTARRRSPKQSGVLGRAGSFGLNTTVQVPSLSPPADGSGVKSGGKRYHSEVDTDAHEGTAKRVKGEAIAI